MNMRNTGGLLSVLVCGLRYAGLRKGNVWRGIGMVAQINSQSMFLLGLLSVTLILTFTSPAQGTIWWDGDVNNVWGNPANWSIGSSGGANPPSPENNDVEFSIANLNNSDLTLNLNSAAFPKGTIFTDSMRFVSSGSTTINPNPTAAQPDPKIGLLGSTARIAEFTFNGQLERTGIQVTPSSGPVSITAPIYLRGSQVWRNATQLTHSSQLNLNSFALELTGAGNTSLSGTVIGTGRLSKSGTGSATLSGNNSYAGGTFISGGNLFVHADSTLGSGLLRFDGNGNGSLGLNGSFTTSRPLELHSNGQIDTRGHSLAWNGPISGSGRLTKFNSGYLYLNGSNSSTGGITIDGGVVQANSLGVPTAGSIIVNNGSRLEVYAGGSYGGAGQQLSLNGSHFYNVNPEIAQSIWQGNLDLSGSNSISGLNINGNVTGNGGLTSYWTTRLDGYNTYSGGTNNQGLLVGDTDSLQGIIDNYGNIVFEQGFHGTLRGEIRQSGTLYKDGAGVLTINSAVSNPMVIRGESIQGSAGTLRNSIDLYSNTAVTFNQSVHEGFNYPITGQGSVIVTGFVGRLDLNHTGNNFSGGLSVVASTVGGNGSTLGTGLITLHGSNLEITAQVDIQNPISIPLTSEIRTGANNIQLSGNISGSGSLRKRGSGYIWLTGSNASWSGGAVVTDGSIYFSNDNHFGTGAITLDGGAIIPWAPTNGASLSLSRSLGVGASGGGINTNTHTLTYSGTLSGSGTLRKEGTGTLYITSTNTSGFTGNYHLKGGTLTIGAGLSLGENGGSILFEGGVLNLGQSVSSSRPVTLMGSSQVITEGFFSTLAGPIGGTGQLIKSGGGDLTLSGLNDYTGGTVMNGGRLFPKTGSLGSGPLTFNAGTIYFGVTSASGNPFSASNDIVLNADANGGTLYTFGNNATLSGNISGPGGLRKGGFGKLILNGTNSYQGNTHVLQHEVRGDTNSIRNNVIIDASTAIEFDQSFNGTFSGSITGAGALTKLGLGTLTLASPNSNVGGTYIHAGKLAVNGSIAGDVTVNSLGTLGGDGTINGNVTGSGRVAPGNSPGIFTINGDYTQTATSVLEIEVGAMTPGPGPIENPNAGHDQLQVSGTANLAGRLEVPILQPFVPNTGPVLDQKIDILTASTINGSFFPINSPNLGTLYPSLAMEVQYVTSGSQQIAQLSFVPKKFDIEFDDVDNDGTPEWSEVESWRPIGAGMDMAPTYQNDLTIVNNTSNSQTLDVTSNNYEIARLTVGGGSKELMLMVGNGNPLSLNDNLSSQTSVTIANNGVIALNQSFLSGASLSITQGGMLKGNGLVDLSSETSVGTGTLTITSGTISPGFSVGRLDIDGNLNVTTGGEVVIEINSSSQFDKIDVTGNAAFGGSLTIMTSDAAVSPGMTFDIVTADSLTDGAVFTDVDVVGTNNYFFKRIYGEDRLQLFTTAVGDMNNIPGYDDGDKQAFALALKNPRLYSNTYGWSAEEAGDFNGNGFDFDDIPLFAAAHGIPLSSIFDLLKTVPEPSALVLIGLATLVVTTRRSTHYSMD